MIAPRQGSFDEFSLDSFRKQLKQIRKLRPIQKVLAVLPGMGQLTDMMPDADADRDMRRMGGVIDSMTADEKHNPTLIDLSRRRRIAAGGEPQEVNELVRKYEGMAPRSWKRWPA